MNGAIAAVVAAGIVGIGLIAVLIILAARGKARAVTVKDERAKPAKAERSGGSGKSGSGGKPSTRSPAPRSGKGKAPAPKKKNQPPKGKAAATRAVDKKAPKTKEKPADVPEKTDGEQTAEHRKKFPEKFPFWARLKIGKPRPTLVIDEEPVLNKRKHTTEQGFVHREATHTKKGNEYEEISPNPDKSDPNPMYLKRPRKLPQRLFAPNEQKFDMPDDLQKRYDKNNHKGEDKKE